MSYENLCMNCMKDKGNSEQCPHCHFHNDSLQLPPFLPMRTVLKDQYLVGAVLETNGDGTTYMAFDMKNGEPVTIREFFPDMIAKRQDNGTEVLILPDREIKYRALLGSFLDLWSKLGQMNGLSALIQVETIFEENNTAYAVSEYVPGAQSLRDYLLSTKNGYLSWEEARPMFMPVLSTLTNLHAAGIIHRGISPSTLYIYPDRKLRIGGFSIPECRMINGGLTVEVFSGYTPVEQLGVQSATGPWTDIYSFAATLYRALIGKAPIDAMVRLKNDTMTIPAEFAETLPENVSYALVNALQVLPEDRTRNTDRLRAELSDSQVAHFASQYEEKERERKRQIYAAKQAETQKVPQVKQDTYLNKEDLEDKKSGKGIFITILTIILVAAAILLVLSLTVFRGQFKMPWENKKEQPAVTQQSSNMVEVPDFTGMNYNAISNNSSFTSILKLNKEEEQSDKSPGTVIGQDIKKGTKVPEGSTITLTVAVKGKIVMKDVTGKNYEDAKAILQEAGFKVEKNVISNTEGYVSDTVASASRSPGSECDPGSWVTLNVWGKNEAPETTEEPTLEIPETETE